MAFPGQHGTTAESDAETSKIPNPTAFQDLLGQLAMAHQQEVGALNSRNQLLKREAEELRSWVQTCGGPVFDGAPGQASHEDVSLDVTALQKTNIPSEGSGLAVQSVTTMQARRFFSDSVIERPDEMLASSRGWRHKLANFLQSNKSYGLFGFFIMGNILVMAFELQFDGIQVGNQIGFNLTPLPARQAWPGADVCFQALNTMFTIIFTVELLLHTLFMPATFYRVPLNWMDVVVVAGGWVELLDQRTTLNSAFLRLLRLAKLSRILKVIKTSGFLAKLNLLVSALLGSFAMLGWSLCLIAIIQVSAGMVLSGLVAPFITDEEGLDVAARHELYIYYGSFTRTMLTMFEVLFANWLIPCRMLVDGCSEYFALFFIFYRCLVGFACLNLINAVFVQQTMQVSQADVEMSIKDKEKQVESNARKLRTFFKALDKSKDGMVSLEEFRVMLTDKRLQHWLSHLGLETFEVDNLFELLDDGDGYLVIDEFLEGAMRLKGSATGIDMARLLAKHRRLEDKIDYLWCEMNGIVPKVTTRHFGHAKSKTIQDLLCEKVRHMRALSLNPLHVEKTIEEGGGSDTSSIESSSSVGFEGEFSPSRQLSNGSIRVQC